MPPLVIPMEGGRCAVIPLGITAQDFDDLLKTLEMWKRKIVLPAASPSATGEDRP